MTYTDQKQIAATEAPAAGSSAAMSVDIEAAKAPPSPDTTVDTAERQNDTVLHGFKLYAVAIGVCFGALMVSIDISIVGTAIPSITTDFGDTSQLAWYPAAYTFATCAVTPLTGKMAAVFPINWVYMSFSSIFLVGSIVCGAAPTSNAFIAGRAISGIGAAGVASNGLTILVTIAPPRKKPLFMGLGAACFALGLVVAPILGGAFTERLTWRWCFWINLPFVAITLAVISFFFKRARKLEQKTFLARVLDLDLVGCVIFVPAVFMLLLAMQRGGVQDPWTSATVVGLFVGSGVTMILFVAWEYRKGDAAMIPKSVAGRRTVIFTVLFAASHMGSLTIASYYLPEWFQAVQGVGPLQSGVRMLPTIITQLLTTMVASGLALRIRYYNPWFFLAPIFMCTASVLYTQFTAFTTPPSHWIGFQVIQGFGAGFGMQMASLSVQLELKNDPTIIPVGIALVTFVQYLGATVAQVIAGTIFNNDLKQQLMSQAGLSVSQVDLLLDSGIRNIRGVTDQHFPELLSPVLEAYNSAITKAFYVPVAGGAIAFFLSYGIKWNVIEGAEGPRKKPHVENDESKGDDSKALP
ncbi:putative MFS transporter [Podospora appendiculata]|uniref:MFS transporter n=1 Tax=Podospora appendiculata TaxID=314037 RepID=A0AAE1CBY3_9PEZI|nr:putative MFS transporter [Podospora appendiculata]